MDIVRTLDNEYCLLRDMQYAAYTKYAKHNNLTTNELFVLDIVWFDEGCLQSYICERLSANKQTVNEIVKKFLRLGYFELRQSVKDRRSKGVFMYLHKGKATRIGFKFENDKKVRFAKSTGEVID